MGIPVNDGVDAVFDEPELRAEAVLIKEGFLHPNIGWTINVMPGFPPSTNVVTYYPQVIPPPLRAWVKIEATRASMVFRKDRKFTEPGQDGSEV